MPNFGDKIPESRASEKQSVTSRYEKQDQIKLYIYYMRSLLMFCRSCHRFLLEFDKIECLGKGAFGRVFKARRKLLQKFYAVKIVHCKE